MKYFKPCKIIFKKIIILTGDAESGQWEGTVGAPELTAPPSGSSRLKRQASHI